MNVHRDSFVIWRAGLLLCSLAGLLAALSVPAANYSNVYPGKDWERRSPAELGFDARALQRLVPRYGIGGVIIRHGYLVAGWGDPELALQSASMGKAFTGTTLGLAIEAGLVKLDDPVWKTWTGEGQLEYPHQYLNAGHHSNITWRHFVTMTAGFPHGDELLPGVDTSNYANNLPGHFVYSDGGMWRFSQALTKLWDKDLKDVLDEKIFSHIGVPASRWDWFPGKLVHDEQIYPEVREFSGYGRYLDPPYEIDGHTVRGGPGWVVINANDLARFGYLMLRHGQWKGQQLLSEAWTTEMWKPQTRMSGIFKDLDYGLNWWVYHSGNAIAARGGGGITTQWWGISSLWVVPGSDLVIALTRTNVYAADQQEALQTHKYDEADWIFQVADAIVHPER